MTYRVHLSHLLISLLFLLPLGCSQTTKPVQEEPAKPSVAQADAPSQEEMQKFGDQLVIDILESKTDNLKAAFNYGKFLDITLEGVEIPNEGRDGLREGFLGQLESTPGGFFRDFLGSRVAVLRVHEDEGQGKVLVRALVGDPPALTYLDLFVEKNGDKVRAFDVHSYATGEPISQTVRRVILPAIAQLLKTPLQKLTSGGTDLEYIEQISALMEYKNSGQTDKAIEVYNKLSPEIQKLKAVQLNYVGIMMDSGDDAKYLKAMEDFRAAHSDDASLLLMQIDYFFLKKDFDSLYKGLDQLEAALGVSDPYLDCMRASGRMEEKKYDQAAELARKSFKAEPSLEHAYWTLANIGLAAKKTDATVEALDHLIKLYPDELKANVQGDPAYASFVESAAGKAWLAK